MTKRRLVALASMVPVAAFTLMGAGSAPSSTAPSGVAGVPSYSLLTPASGASSASSGSNAVTPAVTNPYGCYGQSMNPHESEHQSGNITAESRTACPVPVSYLAVQGLLKRALGLGFTNTLDTKPYDNYGVKQVEVHPGAKCPVTYNSEYLEYGYHYMTENGQPYTAETEKSNWVTC